MSRPRLRLQPSTAVAAIALFVALGGTSYAVTGGTQYPANAINGSALKDRSVAGTKLENHTITGLQVDVTGFPTVPSAVFAGQASSAVNAANATNATNATTAKTATNATHATSATTAGTITGTIAGAQVTGPVANATSAVTATTATTAGTITGTVTGSQIVGPVANAINATNATTAGTATSAATATNATAVDGDQLVNISDWSNSATDSTLATNLAGLTLAMRCVSGNVELDASSAVSGASFGLSAVANSTATVFVKAEGSFAPGSPLTATIANPAQVSFSYEQNGLVASGNLTVFDDGGICAAFGVAQYS